ncbi:hypothetical protein AJ88_15505 [Mesorhizobium amorphae CCBAU 01583]|nr:hypothetical protein AJ88_15505 [Mesorhizobium amorphae CCBAU 01583]
MFQYPCGGDATPHRVSSFFSPPSDSSSFAAKSRIGADQANAIRSSGNTRMSFCHTSAYLHLFSQAAFGTPSQCRYDRPASAI